MSIYEITYSLVWERLSPPNKRQPKRLAWGAALLSPLQWLVDLIFGGYANGDTTSQAYSNGIVYVKYDRVRYNNRIYECYNTPPSAGYAPTNANYWLLIQGDWRGVNERIKYNGQKLILEYVLNRWFNTTFNQPSVGVHSTYFITKLSPGAGFIIRRTFESCSVVKADGTKQKDFIRRSYQYQLYDFQVNYPVGINADAYKQMVSLVEQYRLAGTNPKYVSY